MSSTPRIRADNVAVGVAGTVSGEEILSLVQVPQAQWSVWLVTVSMKESHISRFNDRFWSPVLQLAL